MNIKALITTLALVTGMSASSAMADVRISGGASVELSGGVIVRDHRAPRYNYTPAPVYTQPAPVYTRPAPIVRDHRTNWFNPRPHFEARGWLTLATGLREGQTLAMNGRQNLDTLMIRGLDENVTIGAVTIEYMNGTRQIERTSKQIGRGQSLVLSLDSRAPIRRITVAVSGRGQGSYSLFAN